MTSRPTKSVVRSLEARISALLSEETDPHTVSLGKAAVACVRESRLAAEKQLASALGIPAEDIEVLAACRSDHACAVVVGMPGHRRVARLGAPKSTLAYLPVAAPLGNPLAYERHLRSWRPMRVRKEAA